MQIKNKTEHKEKGKNIKFTIFLSLITFCLSVTTNAQCAMCRASLESEGNTVKVQAVNDGIVLLMAVPYVIVAVVGIVIYKMYYKKPKPV